MSRIQLVAETPRAGKWNHRFIVSPTGDLSDSEVAKVVAAARRNLQGEDYLAVSVKTAQSVSGRTGDEILVLTGIEVNKLSGTQRQQIMAQLEQRLAELAVLVTEKIDWEQAGQSLLVERAELVEWEKAISNLLRVKKAIPPVKKSPVARKWHPNQLKLAGGVIGILLVFGLGIWIGSTSSECPKPQSPSQKPGEVAQSNHHESGQNTPGGLGPVLSQPEVSNDNLLWWTCWNQSIAVNHGNTPVPPKDVNEKAEAEQPTLDKQKIDSGGGNTTQEKSGKSSLGGSVDKNTWFQNFSGKKPSNDSEKELQTLFTELKQKSSGGGCKSSVELMENMKPEDISFVCTIVNTKDVKEFIGLKSSVPLYWCQRTSTDRPVISKFLEKVLKKDAIEPFLNLIQQLCTTT